MRHSETEIPRRIIQIYSPPPGKPAELPLINKASATSIKTLHPDYEYILFNWDDMVGFINDRFPEYRDFFDSLPLRILKFDFFRYLAVYELGGFYFDLDIFLAKKLDTLLPCNCVFSFEELSVNSYFRQNYSHDWELANYGFGASPRNPFILAIIENCIRGQKDREWSRQMLSGIPAVFQSQFIAPFATGPGLVTRTFIENSSLRDKISVLFPDDVRDPQNWQKFGNFGVHLMQSSWRKRENFIKSKLARIWETRRRDRYMKLSAPLGPQRTGNWNSIFC